MANKAEKKRREMKKNGRNMFQMRTRRLGQSYGTRDEVVKGSWRGKTCRQEDAHWKRNVLS
jgi:hypothetical protein